MLPVKHLQIFIALSCSFSLSQFDRVDGGVHAQAILDLNTPSAGRVEMKCICQKEKLEFTQCRPILLSFFPLKQETATQSGESAYANHSDKFFMNMFHPKADEDDKGGSGYQTIDGVNRVKNGVKMNFLSGCFASQTASVF